MARICPHIIDRIGKIDLFLFLSLFLFFHFFLYFSFISFFLPSFLSSFFLVISFLVFSFFRFFTYFWPTNISKGQLSSRYKTLQKRFNTIITTVDENSDKSHCTSKPIRGPPETTTTTTSKTVDQPTPTRGADARQFLQRPNHRR